MQSNYQVLWPCKVFKMSVGTLNQFLEHALWSQLLSTKLQMHIYQTNELFHI